MKHISWIFCILIIWSGSIFASEKLINLDSLIKIQISTNSTITQNEEISLLMQIGDSLKYNYVDSAVYYYTTAYKIALKEQNNRLQVLLLNRLGGAKYRQGEFDESLDYFTQAISLSRKGGNKNGIAVGLNNIAIIFTILDNEQAAIDNHINSALLCDETGDSSLLAINYYNIAAIYLNSKNYDTALLYTKKSVVINTLLKSAEELVKLNTLMGNIYNGQGEYSLANESFFKVINNKTSTNKWGKSYAFAGLAITEQMLGNVNKSIYYGKESLRLAKEINAKWDIQNITQILATSYSMNGDFENAYNYHKEYKLYSDSIFNEEKETKLNYLLLKQEDFEYIILAKDNEVKTAHIKEKNNFILLFTLGVLFLLLLIIFLYRTNFLKTKLNKQLRLKNEEIDTKNKKLEQLNATKDTFFRIIGHDLKSPISTVVSFTDLLQKNYDELDKIEILEYIDITKQSAIDTIALLDNILEWAKAQTGITVIKPVKTDLHKLIDKCVARSQNTISAKNISVKLDTHGEIIAVLDKNITESILRNLLSNAIKFTNINGEISISTKKSESGITIAVSDNGVGMSKKKLNSLFQIEFANSTLGTKKEKGTGIGLILCKEFVDKQGGDIWAESELGVGSTFYFKI
ncbi:MAG: tetratricopeptide repeat-containing sensor histidine kinase [Bacteroidota bacterium]